MGKIRTIFDFRNIFLHYICVNLVVMKKRKGKNGVEEQVVKLRKSKEPVIESEIINISDLPYDLQQKLKLSEKQYSEGKTFTNEEVKEMVKKWLTKGQSTVGSRQLVTLEIVASN